jgi:hypothetical protein
MATDVSMEDVIGLDDTQRDSSGEEELIREAGETDSLVGQNGTGKNSKSSNQEIVKGPTANVQKEDAEEELGASENRGEERGIDDIGAVNEADIGGDDAQEEQKAGKDGRDADMGGAETEHGNDEADAGLEDPGQAAQEEEDPVQKAEITLPLARVKVCIYCPEPGDTIMFKLD